MILSYVHLMTFGQWLKLRRTELRFSGGELERRSGISRQYISNLERDTVQEKSQKPIKPSVEVVDKLARALDADINEARLVAGYAPLNNIVPPEIKAIGFDDLDQDDLREIAAFIAFRKAQKEKEK